MMLTISLKARLIFLFDFFLPNFFPAFIDVGIIVVAVVVLNVILIFFF